MHELVEDVKDDFSELEADAPLVVGVAVDWGAGEVQLETTVVVCVDEGMVPETVGVGSFWTDFEDETTSG